VTLTPGAVPLTMHNDRSTLQGRVVGRGKATVSGDARDGSVGEVSFHNREEVGDFLGAGSIGSDPTVTQ
jgi:hypothetical protein